MANKNDKKKAALFVKVTWFKFIKLTCYVTDKLLYRILSLFYQSELTFDEFL